MILKLSTFSKNGTVRIKSYFTEHLQSNTFFIATSAMENNFFSEIAAGHLEKSQSLLNKNKS